MIAAALFSILAGDAADTLQSFANQGDVQMIFMLEEVRGIKTHAVQGEMPPCAALEQMIAGTRIEAASCREFIAIRVRPVPFQSDGWDYACVPAQWVAGMVYNRLGLLLLDLGAIPPETQYCTPEEPSRTSTERTEMPQQQGE